MSKETRAKLGEMLRDLKLPGVNAIYGEAASRAEKEGWGFERFLHHVLEVEMEQRRQKRMERVLKASRLPVGKTLANLDQERLPLKVRRQLPALLEGGFVDRGENLLAFGLPGRGKTHLVCALGAELVQKGYTVHFTPAYALVQRLLAAKQTYGLEKELHRLDAFDVLIIDDIAYIQQNRDETEVLFTLLAERYERRSVVITSNLVFSEWGKIFKDPMTTAAAIDRIIHHCVILELVGSSYRAEAAKARMPMDTESTTA